MADGKRIKPIEYLIIHHSVGPEFNEDGEQYIADRFSRDGKSRGYKDTLHSFHYDPRTGKETFAQAHYALHKYTKDKNKYGWRLVLLINDPDNNVAWGAGNWAVNQRAINVEICGDYSNRTIDEKALLLMADTFAYLNKIKKLNVKGHKEVSETPTACPGKIYTQLPVLRDMFVNRAKYNNLVNFTTPISPPVVPPVIPPVSPLTPPVTPPVIPGQVKNEYKVTNAENKVLYLGNNRETALKIYNETKTLGKITFYTNGSPEFSKNYSPNGFEPIAESLKNLAKWIGSIFTR